MSSRVFRNARILVVDDEPANVDLLRRLLERAGFSRLESTNDSRQAVDLYVQFRPDLILLDLHMPHRSGLEVMDELNQIAEASYLPILMLTGDDTPEAKRDALSRGAKDFLNKPFHSDEVLLESARCSKRGSSIYRSRARTRSSRPRSGTGRGSWKRRRSRSSSGSRARLSFATTTPASTPSASDRWPRSSRARSVSPTHRCR